MVSLQFQDRLVYDFLSYPLWPAPNTKRRQQMISCTRSGVTSSRFKPTISVRTASVPWPACLVSAARRFYLDHLGTEIDQQLAGMHRGNRIPALHEAETRSKRPTYLPSLA